VEAVVHTIQLLLDATHPATRTTDSSPILTDDTRQAAGSLSTTDRTSTEVNATTTIANVETTTFDEVPLLLSTSVLTDTEIIVVTEKVLLHETTGAETGAITINDRALRLDPTSVIIAAKSERLCI
jgi:hypothetical protein